MDSGRTESFVDRRNGQRIWRNGHDAHRAPARRRRLRRGARRASSPRCAAPGAAAPFVASLIGRLPMGAVGLVFILRTNEITGSFALGGLATAAYALSIGLIAPAMGRLIDLKGQTRVLIGTAVVYASALIGFAALPDDAGVLPIVALAALTGASQPPLGATVRSLWNQTLDDPVTRHVLFTGESAVLEAIYIAGPVLIVAGIGGLISIPAAAAACGAVRAARHAAVRRHQDLARVAPRPGPRAQPGRSARLLRRAHDDRHAVRGRRGCRDHRGRRARAVPGRGLAERDRLRPRHLGLRQPRRRRRGEPAGGGRGPGPARDRAAGGAGGRDRPADARRRDRRRSAR